MERRKVLPSPHSPRPPAGKSWLRRQDTRAKPKTSERARRLPLQRHTVPKEVRTEARPCPDLSLTSFPHVADSRPITLLSFIFFIFTS